MKKKYFLFLMFDHEINDSLSKNIYEKLDGLKMSILDVHKIQTNLILIIESETSNVSKIEEIKEIKEIINYYTFPLNTLTSSFMPESFKKYVETSFLTSFLHNTILGSLEPKEFFVIKLDYTPKKEYNLEELLDKININGIDSLSEDEISYLKQYSSEI